MTASFTRSRYLLQKKGRSINSEYIDPYAFWSEKRPGTASVLYDLKYEFTDSSWMKNRNDHRHEALNIYEVHAGSWIRKTPWDGKTDPASGWVNYRELADKLSWSRI